MAFVGFLLAILEVADDGVGGAPSVPTSIGDRIASVGRTCLVDSPIGGGTRITLEVPDAHRHR